MERRWTAVAVGSLLLVFGAVLQVSHGVGSEESVGSLDDVISPRDQTRFEQVLYRAEPYNTVKSAYLVSKAINAIGQRGSNSKLATNACKYVLATNSKTIEEIYYSTAVAQFFKETCKLSSVTGWMKKALEVLKESTDTETLYYATLAAVNLRTLTEGDGVNFEALLASIMEAVEKEDTPQSYAYAFLAASVIPDVDLSALFESIEDIVAQADETESTLYFEGGLGVTSDVINGIFMLANRMDSKPTITEAQMTKFGNYLVTSKYTSSLEEAANVLSAARTLASNKYVVPTALTLTNSQPISSSNPNLALRLTTILGGVVEGVTPKVKSLEDPDGEVNPRTRAMTPGEDKITFSYPMYKDTTGPGQYKVTVSTESKTPSPIVTLTGVELSVIVSFQVAIGSAQLSIVDKDQGVTTKSVSLEYPNTSKIPLQADQHSKVVMTFTLLNKETSKPVTVHQAFVRLSLGAQEIFFVATPDDSKLYSFELDVAESAKDFGQLSGTYSLSLMVGDFALENAFSWDVASVDLKFPGTASPQEENLSYKPKPVIEHLFRVPEKRPPVAVSTAFTVLIFVPLVLLHIVWLVMGANFSNITSGGIWSVLFQAGLGGILCLYYCFWAQLNMFTTLKYLVVIGGFTFITGNRMLRKIAKARQS